MSGPYYFDTDIALFKTFQIRGSQNIQFRAEMFNWSNHAVPEYSSQNPLNQYFNVDYNTDATTINQAANKTYSNALYGVTDQKFGAPYQRTVLLVAKYNF
jgi:hypothetical protein